jgi:chemotaxis protein methyltransferase CheR
MDNYEKFVVALKQKLNFDLSGYKRKQMERRVFSFMENLGFGENYDAFVESLVRDKQSCHNFFEHVTINVSEFFRNPSQWEVLRKKILPQLIIEDKRLYIWSAGCSTGEEPYSLAMTIEEYFPKQKYSILATDCDRDILHKAGEGVYIAKSMQGVSEQFLNKYFNVQGDNYYIKKDLKRCISFSNHNMLVDPFPKQMDFIVCRNVVIYFKEEIKEQLYLNFFEALRPGGILFTGSTEQIIQAREMGYETVAPFFYRRPLRN